MSRFFVPTENFSGKDVGDSVKISGTDVNHLKNVLRKREGDVLEIVDSCGNVFNAKIENIGAEVIKCGISECFGKSETEPILPVILLQGVPKGEKAEFIIQKTVELGINEIWPVVTERTVVRFATDKDREKKTERWQKIAAEAGKQCGRGIIPEICEILDFDRAVKAVSEEKYNNFLKIVPYENETEKTLKVVLQKALSGAEKIDGILFFIGPEGGISQKEIEKLQNNGFESVTLGKRILRTETAGLATLAAIRYEIGD